MYKRKVERSLGTERDYCMVFNALLTLCCNGRV